MEDIRYDSEIGLKINNLGFIKVVRKKNFSFQFKCGKNKFTIVFVKQGKMKFDFPTDGESFIVSEGEIIYIPRSIPYIAEYTEDETITKSIIFGADNETLPSYIPNVPVKKSSKEYSSVFNSITGINMRNTLFLASKAYELLYLMQSKRRFYTKTQKKLFPALNEIYEKYNEKKPVSYYADMCNMSESNFRKLFKEWTGKSPIEFRNMLRIEEAKKLIDSGEFTVEEAAWYVGFNNISFFYELYNKIKNR